MVFFTCTHCGESLKKALVAKHYQTVCKNHTPFVTCVDCLKDFKGNEFEAHTKCFTEEQKYSAKGSIPTDAVKKGEKKQKAWSECVQAFASTDGLQEDEKKLLETIINRDNIPRKKNKFVNFLTSTARSYINKTELIDRVWTKLEKYFAEVNSESQKNMEENGVKQGETGKKKKRKQEEMAGGEEKNEDGQKAKKKKKHSGEEQENGVETENKNKKKNKRPSETEAEVNGSDEPKSKKSKKSKENGGVNESNDKEDGSKKKKKGGQKEKSTDDHAEDDDNDADGTFNWIDTIVEIVNKNGPKNQMKVSKLQKRVLKMYGEAKGCEVDEKLAEKFARKLKKVDSIKLNGEYVTVKS